MTNNQLKAEENDLKKRELDEEKRSNKANEKINLTKALLGPFSLKGSAKIGFGRGTEGKTRPNDPRWYSLDQRQMEQVSSFAYGRPLGTYEPANAKSLLPTQTIPTTGDGTVIITNNAGAKPGVMVINWVPCVGGSSDKESLLKVTAQNIYSYVRHANSGSRNYDPADLMIYLLAQDTIISYHAWMTRVLSLAQEAKSENWYYGEGFLQALGIATESCINSADFDKLVTRHIADLTAYINRFATRANAFYTPANFPYYHRHQWMNSSIFKDDAIKKSQEYMFNQNVFWMYAIDPASKAGCLQAKRIRASLTSDLDSPIYDKFISYDDIVTFGDMLLEALFSQEDVGIISGDILKAYDQSGVWIMDNIPFGYHIDSLWSEEVLTQINAATLVGTLATSSAASVYQDPMTGKIYQGRASEVQDGGRGILLSHTASSPTRIVDTQTFLNMPWDDVTPSDSMVASRLKAFVEPVNVKLAGTGAADTTVPAVTIAGSEIATTAIVVTMDWENERYFVGATWYDGYPVSTSAGFNVGFLQNLENWATFDWAPNIRLALVSPTSGTSVNITRLGYINDWQNYCIVSKENIQSMHYVALQSLFAIPIFGNNAVKSK